ncbi:MAG: M23 family metallopeptidase [Sphingomonadaceae bacterium]|nr:M23 family metallopeptidase [Sphingomonadaceae bacterium]
MRRLSFLFTLSLVTSVLGACIPNEAPRASPDIPPPRLHPDAAPVETVEAEPVWSAQQVVANARTVIPSTYVVQPGDTLGGIGNRTGAGSDIIARTNNLSPPYAIRSGQTLTIPGGRYHLVAAGETGIAIAAAYGVAWNRIVAANALAEPYRLRRGQRLLLPGDTPVAPPSLERRAAAFHIDIDDVLTGGQPAIADNAPIRVASARPKPLPSNMPIAEPNSFAGSFAWPAKGPILSRFGPGASGAKNNGIDIGVPAGTPIRAAADGVVAYAGKEVAVFGGLVLISHGSAWVSAYGHASGVDVVRGQKVTKGQVIGQTGDSGYASRPKLHFELRKDRAPVNPIERLPAQ